MIDLLRKSYDGGANGLRTITCIMLFGLFLGGANSHVKASDSKTLTAHQKTKKMQQLWVLLLRVIKHNLM